MGWYPGMRKTVLPLRTGRWSYCQEANVQVHFCSPLTLLSFQRDHRSCTSVGFRDVQEGNAVKAVGRGSLVNMAADSADGSNFRKIQSKVVGLRFQLPAAEPRLQSLGEVLMEHCELWRWTSQDGIFLCNSSVQFSVFNPTGRNPFLPLCTAAGPDESAVSVICAPVSSLFFSSFPFLYLLALFLQKRQLSLMGTSTPQILCLCRHAPQTRDPSQQDVLLFPQTPGSRDLFGCRGGSDST